MTIAEHWEGVYSTKAPDTVSWFCPHLESSLRLVTRAALHSSGAIIDVGSGESTLVDDLLSRGFRNITVLDISNKALEVTKARLGADASKVTWIVGDITQIDLPEHAYDVWHDRAVFHFLTRDADRVAYVGRLLRSIRPGGHVIVGAFGPEGPNKCSGLNVMRYDAVSLHREFGTRFRLIESSIELHHTPFGTTQQFIYCYCVVER